MFTRNGSDVGITRHFFAIQLARSQRLCSNHGGGRKELISQKQKKLFIRFDPQLVKFEGNRLRISVKPRHYPIRKRFVYIHLKYGEYQRKFIEEWKKGNLKIGEVAMNGEKVIVPFKKEVDLINPKVGSQ